MKRKMFKMVVVACMVAALIFNAAPFVVQAEDVFITIGGGDFSGVYFPAGLAIAEMINQKRPEYGIRATVEATPGSTFNLNAILAGYMEFGMAQSDKQYHAVKGLVEWAKKGPQKDLRSVFSIYNESLTLIAALDAGINSVGDLRGKRVSLGNPGSSQHRMVINALNAWGLDAGKDIYAETVYASDAPAMLQDGLIDAYFFTVGHPSETVRMALSSPRKARIVPISGPAAEKLLAEKQHYTRTTIDMQRYYPDISDSTDKVETIGVMATLCTSAKVPQQVVYVLTKVVFENLDWFRRQHPAFADFTTDDMLKGLSAPLHPGALAYFREAGLIK